MNQNKSFFSDKEKNDENERKLINGMKKKSLYISIIFFLILLIIFIIIIATKPGLEIVREPPQNIVSEDYFNTVENWSPSKGITQSNLLGESNKNKLLFEDCTLFRYDNDFNYYVKPNLNTVAQDYLAGLLQPEQLSSEDFCVDVDEIVARRAKHTCEGENCISVFGNNIDKGKVEEFSVACQQNNNICQDLLTAISFNFSLNETQKQGNNIMTSTTKFLSVKNIRVPTALYDKIAPFYKNKIFQLDTNIEGEKYPAILELVDYNPFDFRQKFRIKRYNYKSLEGQSPFFELTSNGTGFFSNIVFRVGNLKLSYDDENNNFCFVPNNSTPNWLLVPELDLSYNKISTIQRYEMSTYFSTQNPLYKDLNESISTGDAGFKKLIVPGPNLEVIDTTNIVVPSEEPKILFRIDTVNNKWKNKISTNNTIYEPTLKSGEKGKINHRYQIMKFGDISNSLTFFGRLKTESNNEDSITTQISNIPDNEDGLKYNPNINVVDINGLTILQDNQVLWRRIPLYENISIFGESYFINNNGISGGPIGFDTNDAGNEEPFIPDGNTGGDVEYITPKKGLLNLIDFSSTEISGEGFIDSDLTFTVDTETLFGSSASGKFNINLFISEENSLQIRSYNIIEKGENNENEKVTINLDNDIVLTDVNFLNSEQQVQYVSVVQNNEKGGAVFSAEPTNEGISLENIELLLGGYGYEVDDQVYIVQIDSVGNILTRGEALEGINTLEDFNLTENIDKREKLASIKVTEIQSFKGSPNSLLREDQLNNLEELKDYFTNYPFLNKDNYNLPNNSVLFNNKVCGNSPPQIAYLGEREDNPTMIEAKKFLVNTTDPSNFLPIFYTGKDNVNSPFSASTFLRTIQISELNYNMSREDKDTNNFFQNSLSNNLNSGSTLILGRFIPYRYFATVSDDDQTLKNYLFNNNYTQFIPYGLNQVYRTYMNLKDLPSF